MTYGYFSNIDICHKCDNRLCSNPSHLFEGTRKDNMQDASKKGRMATGNRHVSIKNPEKIKRGNKRKNTKLTWKQVDEIREKLSNGIPAKIIALDYPVTARTICRINNGITWKEEFRKYCE